MPSPKKKQLTYAEVRRKPKSWWLGMSMQQRGIYKEILSQGRKAAIKRAFNLAVLKRENPEGYVAARRLREEQSLAAKAERDAIQKYSDEAAANKALFKAQASA